MIVQTELEEGIRRLPEHHVLPDKFRRENIEKLQ